MCDATASYINNPQTCQKVSMLSIKDVDKMAQPVLSIYCCSSGRTSFVSCLKLVLNNLRKRCKGRGLHTVMVLPRIDFGWHVCMQSINSVSKNWCNWPSTLGDVQDCGWRGGFSACTGG